MISNYIHNPNAAFRRAGFVCDYIPSKRHTRGIFAEVAPPLIPVLIAELSDYQIEKLPRTFPAHFLAAIRQQCGIGRGYIPRDSLPIRG
jgi:hypothetical protein